MAEKNKVEKEKEREKKKEESKRSNELDDLKRQEMVKMINDHVNRGGSRLGELIKKNNRKKTFVEVVNNSINRIRYTTRQKLLFVTSVKSFKDAYNIDKDKDAVKRAIKFLGPHFVRVTPGMYVNWKKFEEKAGVTNRRGRKRNPDFDVALHNSLLLTVLIKARNKEGKVETFLKHINNAYSYDVIRSAAIRLRDTFVDPISKLKIFQADLRLRTLDFCNAWIQRWLLAMNLSRKRITHTVKKGVPSIEAIQGWLTRTRNFIRENNITERQVGNIDETNICGAEHLTTVYAAKDAERGCGPSDGTASRCTALLGGRAGAGDGESLKMPNYIVLKVNCKNPYDLTNSRVLQNVCRVIIKYLIFFILNIYMYI